jgi:hypothetical protein
VTKDGRRELLVAAGGLDRQSWMSTAHVPAHVPSGLCGLTSTKPERVERAGELD